MSIKKSFLIFLIFLIPSLISANYRMNKIMQGLQLSRNKPYQAVKVFNALIKQNPRWHYPHMLLADMYDKYYVMRKAIKEFKIVLRLRRKNDFMTGKIHYKLGHLYARIGKLLLSGRHFKKAKAILGNNKKLRKALSSLVIFKKARNNRLSYAEKTTLLFKLLDGQNDWIAAILQLGRLLNNARQFLYAKKLWRDTLTHYSFIGSVIISGNFVKYDWNVKIPLDYIGNGVWKKEILIRKGGTPYKFLINDSTWKFDPENPKQISDGANPNSVLYSKKQYKHTFYYRSLTLDKEFMEMKTLLDKPPKELYDIKYYNFRTTYSKNKKIPVVFTFKTPIYVDALYLSGDFNTFLKKNKHSYQMKSLGGNRFTITLMLTPGRYRYEYISAKGVIFTDWKANDFWVDNEKFGIINAICSAGGTTSHPNSLEKTTFVYKPVDGKKKNSVHLVGSFNHWGGSTFNNIMLDVLSKRMTWDEQKKEYRIPIMLPSGRYFYKFVINKGDWISDPWALEGAMDGYGGKNSIIYSGQYSYFLKRKVHQLKKNKIYFKLDLNKQTHIFRKGKNNQFFIQRPGKITLIDLKIKNKQMTLFYEGRYKRKYGILRWKTSIGITKKGKINWDNKKEKKVKHQVKKTNKKTFPVHFSFFSFQARSVWIAGSFNNWGGTLNGGKLQKDQCIILKGPDKKGMWKATAKIPAGKQTYKLIINQTIWRLDPSATVKEADGFNGFNSVIYPGTKQIPVKRDTSKKYKVTFKLRAPNARSVHVAGSFNKWGNANAGVIDPSICLSLKGPDKNGYWVNNIMLPGRKQIYKFVINKTTWIKDPENLNSESDGLGGFNSVVFPGKKKSIIIAKKISPGKKFTHKFVCYAPKAHSVWVAGSFNNWGGTASIKILSMNHSLVLKGPDSKGYWRGSVKLPTGKYLYKFVINKNLWKANDKEEFSQADGFGGINSVFYLGKKFEKIYKIKKHKIVFTFVNPGAKSVWVAGTFNYWGGSTIGGLKKSKSLLMKKVNNSGLWKAVAYLRPGRYEYKYIINGKKWMFDKKNPYRNEDGFEGMNSVLFVGEKYIKLFRQVKKTVFKKNMKLAYIYLLHEHNNWKKENKNRLKKSSVSGVFGLSLPAFPGRKLIYNYKILTSNNAVLMIMDPDADDLIANAEGGFNFLKRMRN